MKSRSSSVFCRDDRGATLVFFATTIVPLVLFVALAIDGGRLFLAKARLQRAADAASLKGTEVLRIVGEENKDEAVEAAKTVLAVNAAQMKLTLLGEPEIEAEIDPIPLVRVTARISVDIVLGKFFFGSTLDTVRAAATAEVRPLAVVVVFDQSSSMCLEVEPDATSSNCPPMLGMREAAKSFIDNLSPELDFVGITSYGTFAADLPVARFTDPSNTPPIPATAYPLSSAHYDKDDVHDAIDNVQVLWDNPPDGYSGYWEPLGWTNCDAGLQAALAQFANLTQAQRDTSLKVIVFMTDGSPSTSGDGSLLGGGNPLHFDRALTSADTARAQGIQIFSIGLADHLANENSADPYQFSSPWGSIRGMFLRRVANDYAGSVSSGGGPDPEFHAENPALSTYNDLAFRGDRTGRFFFASAASLLSEKFQQIIAQIRPVLTE